MHSIKKEVFDALATNPFDAMNLSSNTLERRNTSKKNARSYIRDYLTFSPAFESSNKMKDKSGLIVWYLDHLPIGHTLNTGLVYNSDGNCISL